MPIVKSAVKRGAALGPVGTLPDQPTPLDPTVLETFAAGFESQNTIVSAFTRGPSISGDRFNIDPNFDPLANIEGFEDFASSFAFTNSRADQLIVMERIKREQKNRETTAAAGALGYVAEFAGGTIDPIIFFPPLGAFRAAKGASVLKRGLEVGRVAFIGQTAAEIALQATQETRTVEESALNIAGGTFLSGVLGTAGAVFAKRMAAAKGGRITPREAFNETAATVERDLTPADGVPDVRDQGSLVIPEADLRADTGAAPPVERAGEAGAPGAAPDAPAAREADVPPQGARQVAAPETKPVDEAAIVDAFNSARWRDGTDGPKIAGIAEVSGENQKFVPGSDLALDKFLELRGYKFTENASASTVSIYKTVSKPSGLVDEFGDDIPLEFTVRVSDHSNVRREPDINIAPERHGLDLKEAFDQIDAARIREGADIEELISDGFVEGRDINFDPPEPGLTPKPEPLDIPEARPEGGSVGAASALPNRTEETMRSAFGIEKATAFLTPGMRTISSPFLATRRISQDLAENAVQFEKNALGIPSPVAVETLVKAHDFKMATTIEAFDRLYTRYLTGNAEGGRAARVAAQAREPRGSNRLSFKEFKVAVGKAMIRGDVHDIPEVQEMARIARRDGFDPLKDKAIAAGLLPEDLDVKTAPSYLSRIYNTEKIVARRDEFVDIVARWLKMRRDTVDIPALRKAEAEAAHVIQDGKRSKDLLDKRGNIRNFIKVRADRDDLELQAIAEEITGRIISTPAGRLPYDAHLGRNPNAPRGMGDKSRGALARRTFLIPDAMIEDFLEQDAEIVLKSYTRTMAPDVEIAARFDDVDMTPQLKEIETEAARASSLVEADREKFPTQLSREKARTRINKRKNQDIEDIQTMMDRLKGIHGRPDNPSGIGARAWRGAREVNLLSKLGGVFISSLPDVFRPVMVEGVTRVMRHAVVPLITNLKGLRMAKAEAKMLGAVSEMTLGTRLGSIADIGDDFGRFTIGERALGATAETFGLVTGIGPWNQFWKEVAGTVTMGRILTESRNWRAGTIKPFDSARLAEAGIDQSMAKRIADQFDKFGEERDGVMNAVTGAWTDRPAAEAMRNAMIREIDNAIVTPGIGDRPTWTTSTQAGRNVSQFKSFMFASQQQVMIAGAQRLRQGDLATLNGILLSVAAGTMVYYFKQLGSGRPVSDDPAVWLAEGIDRSGVAGVFFDVNNMAEKIGINVLPGGPTRSRYASRNLVGALLGPTAGLAEDVRQVVGNTIAGDIRSDSRALRRLLPYQNLFYIRSLLNIAEQNINESLGIPETRKRRKEPRSFRP